METNNPNGFRRRRLMMASIIFGGLVVAIVLVLVLVLVMFGRPIVRHLGRVHLPGQFHLPTQAMAGLVRNRKQTVLNFVCVLGVILAFRWGAPEWSQAFWANKGLSWTLVLLAIIASVAYLLDGDPTITRKWVMRSLIIVGLITIIGQGFGLAIDPREAKEVSASALSSITPTVPRTIRPTTHHQGKRILTVTAPPKNEGWSDPKIWPIPMGGKLSTKSMSGSVLVKMDGQEDRQAQRSQDNPDFPDLTKPLVFQSQTEKPVTLVFEITPQ